MGNLYFKNRLYVCYISVEILSMVKLYLDVNSFYDLVFLDYIEFMIL